MARGLPSLYLDAFAEVARSQSFSRASTVLAVTQSALSQRIRNLEDLLHLTLFLRTPGGVVLTEEGAKLLQYCQTRDSLEEELLGQLGASDGRSLLGTLRVGAYSSVLHSVVLSALAPLLREHPRIRFTLLQGQSHALGAKLLQGEVDLIVLDAPMTREGMASRHLGNETFVVVESTRHPTPHDIYLDNEPQDVMTERFLRHQRQVKQTPYHRRFLHDCLGLIEGARQGLGRAVVSGHLISGAKGLRIVEGFRDLTVPVYLHHIERPYYSKLHVAAVTALLERAPQLLSPWSSR